MHGVHREADQPRDVRSPDPEPACWGDIGGRGAMSRVLVADADAQSLYMIQAMLEGNGHDVTAVANGALALEAARRDPPNLVISDILMPVMDGFALCRAWQADERLRDAPFVFYTATYTDPHDEELALSLGAARFIRKPEEPEVFLRLVREAISDAGAGRLRPRAAPPKDEATYLREYNDRLVARLEQKVVQLAISRRRLAALYEASTGCMALKPPEELVPLVLRRVVQALSFSNGWYFIYDAAHKEFRLLAADGLPQEIVETGKRDLVFRLGEERGLVGLVGASQEPMIVPDTRADPRWVHSDPRTRSALLAPVVQGDLLFGVLSFASPQLDAFDGNDVHHVVALANQMAAALRNNALVDELSRSEARYRLLAENANDVIWVRALDLRLTYVSPAITRLRGHSVEEEMKRSLEETVTPASLRVLQGALREELACEESGTADQRRVRTFRLEFLRKDGSTFWGEVTMTFLRDGEGRPTAILGVTRDITERVRIEGELQQTLARLDRALQGLVSTAGRLAELRDPYTAGHQRRVAELTSAIAHELGVPQDEIKGIEVAALLHDIGKAAVPAEILSKPVRLTRLEFELIRTHPGLGYEILREVEFPWPVAEIVYQHHERLDGSGYPRKLTGDAILLGAKIMSVADVVEAMSSHRPYRPALGIEAALAEIQAGKGHLYDSRVVDACVSVFRKRFQFSSTET
ncbi:TPA: hypothetical protein DCY67_03215 [Candidatus Acetothermia bacterium]|nr:hypothetical protein [Candidatus Acetothermia bacterium]